MRFTNTITIGRRPEEVFAYLSHLEHLPEWNYALETTTKVTPGPVGVGSRYHQVRTIPVRREESLQVVEYDEGRRLTVEGSLDAFRARLEYVLLPQGVATVLTNTVDLVASGPLRLVAPVATRQIRSAVAANLEVLRQILERDASSS
ncbi:MAG: SRPBCC family protein [Nocardioides sp.]